MPIPTSLASERIARKPAQNGREAGDVVTGLTCESPGERPGRLEAHSFRAAIIMSFAFMSVSLEINALGDGPTEALCPQRWRIAIAGILTN